MYINKYNKCWIQFLGKVNGIHLDQRNMERNSHQSNETAEIISLVKLLTKEISNKSLIMTDMYINELVPHNYSASIRPVSSIKLVIGRNVVAMAGRVLTSLVASTRMDHHCIACCNAD